MDSSCRTKRRIGVPSPSQAAPSRKRAKVVAIEDPNHKHGAVVNEEPEESTGKRKRRHHGPTRNSTVTLQPQLPILHRVTCNLKKNHGNHRHLAHYLDAPRLFEGDSKASALRGRRQILDTEEYLDDQSDVTIITYKTYNCNDYHKTVEDRFEQLPMPKDPDVKDLRPYFFRLRKDGDEAKPQSEQMTIVPRDLMDAIIEVTGIDRGRLVNLGDPRNMEVFHHQLYHRRDLMAQEIRGLRSVRERHIAAFFDYVEKAFDPEYNEAKDLFEGGQVAKPHLSKLFGPDEVVVTFQNGQPLAYISENCPKPYQYPLALDCWSWNFDGLFWRERTTLYVDWPSSELNMPISELSTYPLKYNKSGLEEQLRERGKTFWACRRRKYVYYNPPNPRSMQTNLRYMVDMETYQQMHGQGAMDQLPERDELSQDGMDKDQPPDEYFSMLLPAEILGFGFHDRKWSTSIHVLQ